MPPWTRRVLVVEDEPLIRALLSDRLSQAGFSVRTAADVAVARDLLESFDPDIAVLDISLGEGPTGVDLAYAIHRTRPDIGILFLTQHPDPRTAGIDGTGLPPAFGFVHKSTITNSSHLIDAIESVLADNAAAYRTDLAADRPLGALTRPQLDVLRMAALGMTNSAIARQRGTTERTVERHLASACTALGVPATSDVNQRVEAVRRYIAAAGLPTWRPPRAPDPSDDPVR